MALSKIESDSIASTIDLSGISLTLPDGSVTSSKLDTNIAITGNLTVDTDTLYVDSANNRVGIGTTSPSSELFLYKATGGTTLRLKSDGSNTYDGSTIILTSGQITEGTQFGSLWIDCVRAPSGEGNFTIQRRDRDLNYKGAIIGYTDGTNGLRFSTASATTDALSTERMRITGAGNVGIGTSNPTDTNGFGTIVDLNGTSGAAFYARTNGSGTNVTTFGNYGTDGYISNNGSGNIRFSNAGSERMRIDSSGRVGIGTSNPDHVLHISSATNGNLLRLSSDVSGFNSNLTVDGGTANTIKIHAGYFDTLELGANDTSYLTMYTNGNIGYTGSNIALDSTVSNNQYITITGPTTVVIAESGYLSGTYYIRCTAGNSEQEIIINAHRKLYNNGQINVLLDKSQTGTQALSNFRIAEDRTLGKCYLLADGVLPSTGNVSITCLGIGTFPSVALAAKSVTEQYPSKPMLYTNGNTYGVGVYASTSQQGATLNASGQFIGANYAVFACNGDTTQINNRTNSTGTIIDLRYNGAVRGTISTNGTNIAYNTSSDYRLKENNVNITDGISKVKLLKPYRFNFIDSPDKIVDGFFAHEVQNIVPEAVTGEKDAMETIGNIVNEDGDIVQTEVTYKDNLPEGQTWVETETRPVYQGIDQSKLVPLLTAAIQEQQTIIEDLQTRIQALENN